MEVALQNSNERTIADNYFCRNCSLGLYYIKDEEVGMALRPQLIPSFKWLKHNQSLKLVPL